MYASGCLSLSKILLHDSLLFWEAPEPDPSFVSPAFYVAQPDPANAASALLSACPLRRPLHLNGSRWSQNLLGSSRKERRDHLGQYRRGRATANPVRPGKRKQFELRHKQKRTRRTSLISLIPGARRISSFFFFRPFLLQYFFFVHPQSVSFLRLSDALQT